MQKTIKLELPIENHGVKVMEITMRAPRVRDLKAVDHINKDADREVQLYANLTDLSVDAIEGMLLSDYAVLSRTYESFAAGKKGEVSEPPA